MGDRLGILSAVGQTFANQERQTKTFLYSSGEKFMPPVRLELTAFRLWDWRAAYCATEAGTIELKVSKFKRFLKTKQTFTFQKGLKFYKCIDEPSLSEESFTQNGYLVPERLDHLKEPSIADQFRIQAINWIQNQNFGPPEQNANSKLPKRHPQLQKESKR